MFTAVSALLSGAFRLGKSWIEGKVETQKKQLDIKHAAMENKARLLRDTESHNHEWEMANLEDKDRFLRRVSFFIFMAPMLVAIPFPNKVELYFNTVMNAVPEWYIQIVAGINAGIWGLAHLKKGIPAIIGGVKQALQKPNGN